MKVDVEEVRLIDIHPTDVDKHKGCLVKIVTTKRANSFKLALFVIVCY